MHPCTVLESVIPSTWPPSLLMSKIKKLIYEKNFIVKMKETFFHKSFTLPYDYRI